MPIENIYHMRGARPSTGGDLSDGASIPRLLQNSLAQRYFKALSPDVAANYYQRFDIFQNLPAFLVTKVNEIEKKGPPAIIAAAKEYLNIYLIESKYVIPPHLTPTNPRFIEDYFEMEPNAQFDLGQFLSNELAYLQIPESKQLKLKEKMEFHFEQLYTLLRAAEILCVAQNQPALNPPISNPIQI